MKKIWMFMACVVLGATSCSDKSRPQEVDNSLTAEEIAAGYFTPEILWKMARLGESQLSPDGQLLAYSVTRYSMETNKGVTQLYVRDMQRNEVRLLTDADSNNSTPTWSADGKRIYFLSDRSGTQQVWSMLASGDDAVQVTSCESDVEGYGVNGTTDRIWYVETVVVEGAARKSSERYQDMPQSQARVYDDLMCRHWNYWDEGRYRHLFVADLVDGRATQGKDIVGESAAWDVPLAPYFDMAEIAWNHEGTLLAYTCKPLVGTAYAVSTDSDIFVYDCISGSTTNICKNGEQSTTEYNRFPGYDKYPVWSPNDRYIAFRSMATPGYESDKERLMVFDCTNGRFTELTPAFDYSANSVVWADDATLWFIAPMEGTYQLCRMTLPAEGVTPTLPTVVTQGDHDINAVTLAAGRIVVELTTLTQATEQYEVDSTTGTLTSLSQVNRQIYEHIARVQVQKRWVKTTDGKQMLTWVILPPDFDPAKRYPTLLFCEGGPQSVVSQGWSYRWNFALMASQGYVVVAPNRRGCPSFGQEWLEQISGDYSGQNIADYLSAIDDVAKESWCDTDRLGCIGASYGGYSVYFLAGCHQKRFKAFIAHCGIFDFDSMYGQTEEIFFVNHDYGGAYWEQTNATAMRSYANSPHKFVDKWDTPILIVTGEKDYRIPYTQSLEAFTAARLRGIPARLVVFENEGHQVFKPQNSMVWNREFFGWLDHYVKQDN
jgi:dipeptidyl aminopeptidase/acylaminoacyl peptidase